MLVFAQFVLPTKVHMIGNLRVLDAPEFLFAIREVLKRAVTGMLSPDANLLWLVPSQKEYTIMWSLFADGHTILAVHLIHLKEVRIECVDRDVFEGCLGHLLQFLDGEEPDTGKHIRMNTQGIDVTLFLHDATTRSLCWSHN